MILKYRAEVGSLIRDHDEARTLFNAKTIDMEDKIKKHISNKCFYVILATAVVISMLYGGIFYYMQDKNRANILTTIERAINE